jgi:uncharacterized oxidoreductase
MKLSGNTILITGGSAGIGYAMAEAFLRAGNSVIICGRRRKRLLDAQKKLTGLNIKVCDISSAADRKALFEHVRSKFSQLNVIVNNAGIQKDIDLTKGVKELSTGESEIRINLEATVFVTGLFLPLLMGKNNAYIFNVSSGLGFVPIATMPLYCATKAALHSYSLSLRHQLAKTGIKVIEIIPPMVDTELNPERRKKRDISAMCVQPMEFVSGIMKGIENDEPEIGYGFTEGMNHASREDLDMRFRMMNGINP